MNILTEKEIEEKLLQLFGFGRPEKQGDEIVEPIDAANQLKIFEFMRWLKKFEHFKNK